MMRFGLLAASVLAGVLGIGAAAAPRAQPPPGAQISASLEYVTRVPGTEQVVEGKFDKVQGREVLIITGRFGFKTLDVSDPTNPQVLDTFQPPEILGPNGYWQDEDMDIDVRRNLIIGALDPRHDNVDQASCPGIGTLGSKNRNPGLPLRLLRHLVPRSGEPPPGRQLRRPPAGHTVSCIDGCNYVWAGGPARRRRPGRPRAVHAGRPRRRPADLGHRSPEPDPAEGVPRADRPLAQRRADRLLARRGRRRQRHRLDERSRRAARLRDPGQVARSADGRDAEREAVGSDPRRRRRHRGRAGRRRPAADGLHPQRGPTARRQGAGRRRAGREHRPDDRGGLHRAVQPERSHRRRRHHRLARRRAGDQLHAGTAVPAERAERVPPDTGRRRHDVAERLVLRALLRGGRLDGGRGVVRPGAPPDRRVRCSQPAAGRATTT